MVGLPLWRPRTGTRNMTVQPRKPLAAVESDLKQLMADVTRAMANAQNAITKLTAKAGPAPETEAAPSAR